MVAHQMLAVGVGLASLRILAVVALWIRWFPPLVRVDRLETRATDEPKTGVA